MLKLWIDNPSCCALCAMHYCAIYLIQYLKVGNVWLGFCLFCVFVCATIALPLNHRRVQSICNNGQSYQLWKKEIFSVCHGMAAHFCQVRHPQTQRVTSPHGYGRRFLHERQAESPTASQKKHLQAEANQDQTMITIGSGETHTQPVGHCHSIA